MEKKFLRIGEFSRETGLHPNTIRNMDRDGRLKPHHINDRGDRFYTWKQVENIINKQR